MRSLSYGGARCERIALGSLEQIGFARGCLPWIAPAREAGGSATLGRRRSELLGFGGKALLFGGNGVASTSFRGPAASFLVRAPAGSCGGHMVMAIDSKTVLDRVITEPTWRPDGVVTSVGAGQHTLSVKQDNQPGSCDNRLRVDFAEAFTALGWRSIGQPPLQVPTDAELANFHATAPPCFSPCKEAP